MPLVVESLALHNWRNIEDLTLAVDPSLTLLVGPNASGKTNTIEALTLLTRGSSPRRARAADQVAEGKESGWAKARLTGDGRVIDLGLTVDGQRRSYRRNGKPTTPQSMAGTLLSVLFTPDDLLLAKGPASQRRDELDGFGAQASEGFRNVARTYARSVAQRNRLLKEENPDPAMLDAWDESLAVGGGTLTKHRLSLFATLKPLWEEAYAAIAGGEALETHYLSTLVDGRSIEGNPSREELIELMARALAVSRPEDLRRGMTCVGPQRDDIEILVAGRDARSFASQGQQRSIVLAWKLALVRFCEQVLGERPILLLDDVMSELDDARRASLASLTDAGIQTIVTTTHLGYFDDAMLERGKVVSYGAKR